MATPDRPLAQAPGDAEIRRTLELVKDGALSVDAAAARLRSAAAPGPADGSTDRLEFANVDHDRESRCGFPEVVLCAGKTAAQVVAIAQELLARSPRALLTRADAGQVEAVQRAIPDAVHHERSGCITIDPSPLPATGLVAIVAAGTGDLPVAEEAVCTARIMGAEVATHWDVGVAGLHRLAARIESIRQARVIVAIAGMEGALASVLGGLVDRPVIAVPTSVGARMGLAGLVPLLAMLNSCAAGVGVVNVDNGFGGGYLAALINRTRDPIPPSP